MKDAKQQIFIEYTQLSFNIKIKYIKCLNDLTFRFKDEPQPDAWIQALMFSNINEDQLNPDGDICDIIETIFGLNIICKETSICSRRYCTILDSMFIALKTIETMDDGWNNAFIIKKVIEELIARGAKLYEQLIDKKVYILEEELDMDRAFVVGNNYSFDA